MRSRSVAAVVLLVLVAGAGVFVVRELTEPAPRQPIGPIRVDPGTQTGEAGEDEPSRTSRRESERNGDGGFDLPETQEPEPGGGGGAPTTPPPQIEVKTPEALGGSDDAEDGD